MQTLPPRSPLSLSGRVPPPLAPPPPPWQACGAAAAAATDGDSQRPPRVRIPGGRGLGGGRVGSFAPGRRGRGGCSPACCLPACPLGSRPQGSRPQGPLQREGRAWWPDPGSTSYLVDFPVPFSPGQHASFAGRKPKDPESPNVLKCSLEKRKKPFTFQDGNVTLFEYDFSFFTCRNMQVEAFQAMRKLCRG